MAAGRRRRSRCFAFTLSFKGIVISAAHWFFCVLWETKYSIRPLSAVFHHGKLQSTAELQSHRTTATKRAHWITLQPWLHHPYFGLFRFLKHPQFETFMVWCVLIGLLNGNLLLRAVNHKYVLNIEPWHFISSSHFGTLYKLIRLIIDCIGSLLLWLF